MMTVSRLLITGTNSGSGKTTLTCALLSALKMRGLAPTAFKCGPDFIDPMFHRAVSDIPAYNLDPFFMDSAHLRAHLAARTPGLAIIEGVMGYYDGINSADDASAYVVARETQTPAVLVVDARGASHSLSAVIAGFVQYRPNSFIKGVIFNNAEEAAAGYLQERAEEAGVQMYGVLPYNAKWELPNRHLGLLMAAEIANLQEIILELGKQAEASLDIDGLLALAGTAPDISVPDYKVPDHSMSPGRTGKDARLLDSLPDSLSDSLPDSVPGRPGQALRLAVARDEAFCFLYEESLELLAELGCELAFFSPIRDRVLPEGCQGLYLCGGYPELHSQELSANESMKAAVRTAVLGGLPTIAECGGFMYLHESLDGLPMCGVIKGATFMTDHLQRFGYMTLTAKHDNMLCPAGGTFRAQEFHYSDSTNPGDDFIALKASGGHSYPCIHASDSLYAGYPDLYLAAHPSFAARFVEKMRGVCHG